MAQEFAISFYRSTAWKKCRKGYISSVNGMCERCLKDGKYAPGYILHHKISLSPKNINDITVTLNWKNLEFCCQDCHNKIHMSIYSSTAKGLMFDSKGNLIVIV